MQFAFTVTGTPVPKARARACKDGKHRTPKKTRDYETHVRNVARWFVPPGWPLDGAYKLSVSVFFPDFRKRDHDNCVKSIADALNGLAFDDDSQITKSGEGEKVLGDPNPRAEVTVEWLGAMPARAGARPKPKSSSYQRAIARAVRRLRAPKLRRLG